MTLSRHKRDLPGRCTPKNGACAPPPRRPCVNQSCGCRARYRVSPDMAGQHSDNPTIEHIRPPAPPGPPTIAEMSPHFPQLEILDLLGAGGMGVVYKARQKSLDRLVALKVLPPHQGSGERHESFTERFTREARALARLQHPNIVTVYDSGSVDDLCYFIMEFVDGSNLRQLMGTSAGRLSPQDAMAIVPGVCDALEYAHAEGIAHRDIKPENILIDRKGRVKIADFGIAKLLQSPGTNYTLTHTQQVIGTMHYMAPEQIERPASVDHRADIYSLGVVLYEMVTGELPLGRFPLPSERALSDPRLDQVVLRALEKEPARRYQRASEIKTDLQRLGSSLASEQPGSFGGSAAAVNTPHPMASTEGPAWRRASVLTPPPPPLQPASSVGRVTPLSAAQAPFAPPAPGMRSEGVAYLCWAACLLGFNGIHRMYAGKWISGFVWFFTLGLLFLGQLIDLLLIPRMIRKANRAQAALLGLIAPAAIAPTPADQQATRWVRIIFLLIAVPLALALGIVLLVAVIIPILAGP